MNQPGRLKAPLHLTATQRGELESFARSRSLPHGLVRRARIILLSADGMTNKDIAARVALSGAMVGLWRKWFLSHGVVGLYDEPRPAGPRSIGGEKIAAVIRKTLRTKPKGATHWSCHTLAEATGLSKSTVHRIWKAFGLQPHRHDMFV